MNSLLVPEIEGGYPERHGGKGAEGEEEGLVFEYSSSWMDVSFHGLIHKYISRDLFENFSNLVVV